MTTQDTTTFPFTQNHLKKFKRELKKAGSFHALMIEKKALEQKNGAKYITHFYDMELYKKKFLIGSYKSLRPMYETDVPFNFWSDLHEMLLEEEIGNI